MRGNSVVQPTIYEWIKLEIFNPIGLTPDLSF